jgi:hypothetical protein
MGDDIWARSRSSVTPYVVEADRTGAANAIAPAPADYQPSDPQIGYFLMRCFQNNAPMSSGCIVDFVTPGVDDGLAIDVGNEGRQAFVEFVFGADADVAQDRTRQL